MKHLNRLIAYIKYGTTDPDRIRCIEEGHDWEVVGVTTVSVPKGEKEWFGKGLDSDRFNVVEGAPMPEGAHTWAPIETTNQRCSRCGLHRTHRTP